MFCVAPAVKDFTPLIPEKRVRAFRASTSSYSAASASASVAKPSTVIVALTVRDVAVPYWQDSVQFGAESDVTGLS